MSRQKLLSLLLLAPLLLQPGQARADDDYGVDQKGQVIAVQQRPYRLVHEFTASAGVLPMDAFTKGLTLGAAYTLHFSDLWAWEALSFTYAFQTETQLEKTLSRRWSVAPTGEPELQLMIGSNVILSPSFGKLSLFNHSILQVSTFFSFGGGVIRFSDGNRPFISAGPGLRMFWGKVVSTRLELRNIVAPDQPDGVDYEMHITLSVSFNFGSRRATETTQSDLPQDTRSGYEDLDELYPLSTPKPSQEAR